MKTMRMYAYSPLVILQAWCKFYELVSEYNLIPKEAARSKSLYTLHLCEAPGAFVASLNHYLKLNHPEIVVSVVFLLCIKDPRV